MDIGPHPLVREIISEGPALRIRAVSTRNVVAYRVISAAKTPVHIVHRPEWYYIPVRVLLVTFLLTLLSFAVALLLGILGTVLVAGVRGLHPDMTHAYRHVALPVAVIAAVCTVSYMSVLEVRRFRQARALARIEHVS